MSLYNWGDPTLWEDEDDLAGLLAAMGSPGGKKRFKSVPMELKDLPKVLQQACATGIEAISLKKCEDLGSVGAEEVFNLLKDNRTLAGLFLQGCGLGNYGAKHIGELLKVNDTLDIVSLKENGITNVEFIDEVLRTNTTLRHLFLSHNPLENQAVHVISGLIGNRSLVDLSLNKTKMTTVATDLLANTLATHSTLETLRIADNDLSPETGVAFANSLKTNKTLTYLDMSSNESMAPYVAVNRKNDDRVLRAFAHVLRDSNRTLQVLDLTHCGLYPKMANMAMITAVQKNTTLRSVRMLPYSQRDQHLIDSILDSRLSAQKAPRLAAFRKAIHFSGTVPWMRSKLMVVGQGAAGKSSTVRSLLGYEFKEGWTSTIGVELTEVATSKNSWKKTLKGDYTSHLVHRLAVESLEPQQKQRGVVQRVANSVKKVVPGTLQSLRKSPATPIAKKASKAVAATPSAAVETKRTDKEIPSIKYNDNMFIGDVEKNKGVRVSIWDYGGQSVFYTLHHLFLTQYGVYLVVFSLPALLQDTKASTEYLKFWLNSIKLHAPNAPLLLTGTNLDELAEGDKPLRKVQSVVSELCRPFTQVHKNQELLFFPISNKTKMGVFKLRKAIEKVTNASSFVRTKVSLKWMQALDLLSKEAGTMAWIELASLKSQLLELGFTSSEEIQSMLKTFHELGVVLYFSTSVQLREIVICKPQWLLDMFSVIIRDRNVHAIDTKKLENAQLTNEMDQFLDTGLASRDLLEFLWNGTSVDYLLDLMSHLLLLSNWNFSSVNEMYLVPSMVIASPTSEAALKGHRFYFQFDFLPKGIFERLYCLCVEYSGTVSGAREPTLNQSSVVVDLGGSGDLCIEKKTDRIVVTTTNKTTPGKQLNQILSMMNRIKQGFVHSSGLKWNLLLEVENQYIDYETVKKRSLKPWVVEEIATSELQLDKFLNL